MCYVFCLRYCSYTVVEYAEGDDEGTLQVVPTNWVKLDKKSGGLHVVFLAKDPAALCACDPSVDIGTNETLLGVKGRVRFKTGK